MGNVNSLISERLKKTNSSTKMSALAKQTVSGSLTSFSGIFSVSELNSKEKEFLETILKDYATGQEDFESDFSSLLSITSEVKAINNQAALLHGERIKKAQSILTRYKDGAFTTWLIAAYGNRQTPYNFLQYYEFCELLPKLLRPQIEAMPRQAVYTLASREAPIEKKQLFVEEYKGETKSVLLNRIRELFPLAADDKRRHDIGDVTIKQVYKLAQSLDKKNVTLSKSQKAELFDLIEALREIISLK